MNCLPGELVCKKNKNFRLILLTIVWVIWKKRNNRAFKGKEDIFGNIKDKWFHFFDSIVLEHNLVHFDDFGSISDMFIDL